MWTTAGQLDQVRDSHVAGIYRENLYVVGGEDHSSTVLADTPVMGAKILDNKGTLSGFVAVGPLVKGRRNAAMLIQNGLMLISGGIDSGANYLGDLLVGAINTNGTIKAFKTYSLPVPTAAHIMFVLDGYLHFCAGYTTGSAAQLSIWRTPLSGDGSIGVWRQAGNIGFNANALVAPVIAGRTLFWLNAPGSGQNLYWTSILSNGSNGPIKSIAVPWVPAYGKTLMAIGGRVFAVGGLDVATTSVYYMDSWVSKLASDGSPLGFTMTGNMTAPMYGPVAAWDKRGRAFLTGGINSTVDLATVQFAQVDYEGNI